MFFQYISAMLMISSFLSAQPAEYHVEEGQGNVKQIIHLPGKPQAAAVSPDRERLAIGVSSTLLLINFADGSLKKSIEFDNGDVRGVAFLEGKQKVAVAGVGGVSVYETASGKLLTQVPGHPNARQPQKTRTYDVAYLPNQRQLVTISEDESNLRFWSADDGAAGKVLDTQIKRPQRLVVSPDHSLLAVSGSGSGGVVVLFRLPDLQEVWRNEEFGVNPVLAFSPDSRLLAVGDDGGGADVLILNAGDGTEATSRYVGSGRVGGLGWTAGGGIVTAPSRVGFGVYFYPLKTEDEQPQILDKKLLAEEDVDNAVAIGSGDRFAAVIGTDRVVKIFKLAE